MLSAAMRIASWATPCDRCLLCAVATQLPGGRTVHGFCRPSIGAHSMRAKATVIASVAFAKPTLYKMSQKQTVPDAHGARPDGAHVRKHGKHRRKNKRKMKTKANKNTNETQQTQKPRNKARTTNKSNRRRSLGKLAADSQTKSQPIKHNVRIIQLYWLLVQAIISSLLFFFASFLFCFVTLV